MGLRLLAIACLVGAAFAGPFQRETGSRCSSRCSESSNEKFNYEVGKKYVYEYRGENYISAAGHQKEKATIEGLAEIHVIAKCEMALQLRSLRIQQKLSQQEIQELKQKLEIPVPFSYEDGQIESVCPSPEETPMSLNIKKGVLSTLINTMKRLDTPQEVQESDSLGRCHTKYTVKYSNGLEVRKVKQLKSCTNRHESVTALITNPYESAESRVHTLPIFPEESLECKQNIEDKIIKRVQCREEAKIQPLKKRDSVIEFQGEIELTYLSVSLSEPIPLHEPKHKDTIFYNLKEQQSATTQEHEVEQILREICEKNSGVIDISVSKQYIRLISLVKGLSYESLDKMHQKLKDGRICSSKKVLDIFVDTLPMSGSDAAIKLMVKLLERQEISGLKAKLWPASLALISKPTKEALSEVLPLLKLKNSAPVLLGVSAMVNRFCSNQNCDHTSAVKQIVHVLNQQLGQGCSSDNEAEVLAVLKAFGNMGYLGEAEKNILACAESQDKPIRIRLAAIDAYRRNDQQRPDELLQLYRNQQEDFEVRIAALSCVMKKADARQLRSIKQTAEQEQNEQVSGYTSTLIRNMRKSSSPTKKEVRNLLKDIEMNPPKVKYWENSKNIEMSTFSETFNIGGAVETDVIHSSESKIPRALYTRFDVDVFDKNLNIFELGIRAEGLEQIIKNLIGLKDKIPKEKSWNFLKSNKIFGENEAEASLFIRTMNTEIFDIAASDLTAMGEMIKIADLMNKLSEEKSTDFSHSFLFLNSQLIIPSVTGRSYTFGLTGSATVGLTASSKFDVMSFPKNTDVHARFQPSANVEIATTVGIQSNKHRPDIKLVSRVHLESDMAAQFKIKDGHIVLASVSVPSENVMMARISSDVIEVDAHHQEKRVFDKMQKKIDYCFNRLEKSLGLAICGEWEVPKPFVSKSFPFVHGVGNVEISIKKSDSTLKSYELEVEIPRYHSAQTIKYRASLDTPGSRINRRFAAELLVKQQENEHKKLALELTSPFKKAGGSGLFTKKENLVQGSFELHGTSSQLFSINASAAIAQSRTRQVIRPTLEISIRNRRPFTVEGTVAITNGRKQQISVDMKSNKPDNKPISVKGTITKEGRLEISRAAEWKISSDLAFMTPIAHAQVRSSIEKQSKQAQTISTSLDVDYQRQGRQQHSIKFTSTSQKSSTKISSNAQLESSQYPSASFAANWDMQGSTRHNMKNDITIKYGSNPEKSYISIKQMSQASENEAKEISVAVKSPQLRIDSELTVKHDIQLHDTPKIRLEADLRYKSQKHVRGLIDYNYESKRPLKASTKLQLSYPGFNVGYEDSIEEISRNHFVGQTLVQWKENKQAELKYQYKSLGNRVNRHDEIEGSLRIPSRQQPIKTKLSLQLRDQSMEIDGQISTSQVSVYTLQAQLAKKGLSQISMKSGKLEGILKVHNEEQKKQLELDMQINSRRPRHVLVSASLNTEDRKAFEVEALWDANRQPEAKISVGAEIQTRRRQLTGSAKLQIMDLVNIALSQSGPASMEGQHEGSIEATIRNCQPIIIQYRHQMSKEKSKTVIKYLKSGSNVAEVELEGAFSQSSANIEISSKASLKCFDGSFQDKELSIKHSLSRSGTSTTMKSSVRAQKSSQEVYKAEWDSQVHPNGLEMKAILQTPHKQYKNQAVDLSVQRSSSSLSSSMNIQGPNSQAISFQSEVKSQNNAFSTTISMKSPFNIVRDAKVHISIEKQRSKKSVLSYIDVNNERLSELEGSFSSSSSKDFDIQGRMKITPIPNIELQGLSFSCQKSRSMISVSGKAELQHEKELSLTSEFKKEKESLSATVSIQTPSTTLKDAKMYFSYEKQAPKRSVLFYVDANDERKSDAEITMITSSQKVEVQGRLKTARTPELSAHVKADKNGQSLSLSINVIKGTSPLLKTKISKEVKRGLMQYSWQAESFEKTLLDVEVSREISRDTIMHSAKARGQFAPLSFSLSTSRREEGDLILEVKACREADQKTCYNGKGLHKSLENQEGFKLYKKITLELEKVTEQSEPEQLGSAHVYLSVGEHDYRSKIMFQKQENQIGYEVRVHKRKHENDHYDLDASVYLPEKTSKLRVSYLKNKDNMNLEIEAIPDASVNTRKMSLELKKEGRLQSKMSGYIRFSHLGMKKPVLLTGTVQKQGQYLHQVKIEMDYSSSWNKVLTFEIIPEQQNQHQSILYKLHREDKSIDATLKIMKENSREQDKYGYEWNYKRQSQMKRGGASIILSQKRNGKPQNIDLTYFSPSSDMKVECRSVWSGQVPTEMSMRVLSNGQKQHDIQIKSQKSCVELEIQKSRPLFQSSFCVNKQEGKQLKFISLEAHYHQKKSLEMSISVEPQNPSYLDIVMTWEKQHLRQAMKELHDQLRSILNNHSIQKLERELKQQLKHFKKDALKPALRDIAKMVQDIKQKHGRQLKQAFHEQIEMFKEQLNKMDSITKTIYNMVKDIFPLDYLRNEVIAPFVKAFRCLIDTYAHMVVKHIPELVRIVMEVTKEQFESCLKKFCVQGTFCYNFKKSYDRNGLRQTIRKSIQQQKRSIQNHMPKWQVPDVVQYIQETVRWFKDEINNMFGKFFGRQIVSEIVELGKAIEQRVREKTIELIDFVISKVNDIFDEAEKDEDFRTAKNLVIDTQKKIRKAWQHKEQLVEKAWEPMRRNMMEKTKRLVGEKVKFQKFNLSEGEVEVRVYQQLTSSHVELIINALRSIRLKVQKALFM